MDSVYFKITLKYRISLYYFFILLYDRYIEFRWSLCDYSVILGQWKNGKLLANKNSFDRYTVTRFFIYELGWIPFFSVVCWGILHKAEAHYFILKYHVQLVVSCFCCTHYKTTSLHVKNKYIASNHLRMLCCTEYTLWFALVLQKIIAYFILIIFSGNVGV